MSNFATFRFRSTKDILQGGFGGTPTADSCITVPCPLDRNALRNLPDNLQVPLSTYT